MHILHYVLNRIDDVCPVHRIEPAILYRQRESIQHQAVQQLRFNRNILELITGNQELRYLVELILLRIFRP